MRFGQDLTGARQEPYPERAEGSWWLDLPEDSHRP